MFQTEERLARMFERGLQPKIRRYVIAQRFHTLRDVADAAISQETDFAATQKGKETTAKTTVKASGKDKGRGHSQQSVRVHRSKVDQLHPHSQVPATTAVEPDTSSQTVASHDRSPVNLAGEDPMVKGVDSSSRANRVDFKPTSSSLDREVNSKATSRAEDNSNSSISRGSSTTTTSSTRSVSSRISR